jgi:hypothetical protein
LSWMALSDDQCLALGTMSRLDVELNLNWCSLADDAAGAFVECLQSDRGPVGLHSCGIGGQIIANALAGDSRVTRLEPDNRTDDDADYAFLFRALANNRGLVDLDLEDVSISDENWAILCESLQAHPTLTCLNLIDTSPNPFDDDDDDDDDNDNDSDEDDSSLMPDEQKTRRTRVLAEMMQQNTVLHTIHLSERERDVQLCTEDILPYLETNRYRPRVLGIKKAHLLIRRNLLGLALQTESVRNKSNRIWMFLSGNQDVVVPIE